MKRVSLMIGACLLAAVAAWFFQAQENAMAADSKAADGKLAHMVFFTVKDHSKDDTAKLIAACKKYLVDHPGVEFFAVGSLSEYDRDVNDRDFDVALHIVFKDRAAHDVYQDAPRHKQFIENAKALWTKVRVFDSVVE